MTTAILQLLGSALSIWDSKEKTKYIDRLMILKSEYREALSQTPIDHNRIDNVKDDIRELSVYVSQQITSVGNL